MNTTIPIRYLDVLQAGEAKIVRDNMAKVLGAPNLSAEGLPNATIPVFGVSRNRNGITSVGADRVNSVLARLGNSALPRAGYDIWAAFLNLAYHAADLFPRNCGNGSF